MVIFRLESLDTDKILTRFLFNIEIYYILFLYFWKLLFFYNSVIAIKSIYNLLNYNIKARNPKRSLNKFPFFSACIIEIYVQLYFFHHPFLTEIVHGWLKLSLYFLYTSNQSLYHILIIGSLFEVIKKYSPWIYLQDQSSIQ